MLRKVAIVAVIGLGGAVVLTQTKLGSHLLTAFGKAEEAINDSIPADWELARIKNEIGRLDGDIEDAKSQLVKARVDVRSLAEEIQTKGRDVEASEAWLLKRGEEIKAASQGDKIKWGARSLTVDEAKQELQVEAARYKNRRDELAANAKRHEIMTRNRDLLDKHVKALSQQKSELTTAIAKLEAEINLAKLEQTESRSQDDGSRLASIKKSYQELQKRVALQRERAFVSREFDTANDASSKSVDEILADIRGNSTLARPE